MSSPPVVLCIDFASYAAAVAALDTLGKQMGPDFRQRLNDAAEDLRRAYSTFALIDQSQAPALLRRQAGPVND